MAAMVAVSLVPFALRGGRFDTAMGANLGSACGFGATNIATKLMADDIGGDTAGGRRLGGGRRLRRGRRDDQRDDGAAAPAGDDLVPISTAVQTFLPIALEPLFLTENWRAAELEGLVLLAGLVVMAIGTVLVARIHAVSELASG